MKIKVNLNDINKAINEVEAYKKSVDEKGRLLCKKLAEIGLNVARMGFSMVDTKDPVIVTLEEEGNKLIIKASGKQVCFIEFGTGVDAVHELGGKFGMLPDSWSKDHARQFHDKGYWFYGGKRYIGTVPNECMYNASKEIRARILEVAKEVFNG